MTMTGTLYLISIGVLTVLLLVYVVVRFAYEDVSKKDDKSKDVFDNICFTIFMCIVAYTSVIGLLDSLIPDTNDVIDGKCVIEYTVVDGVRTDSCYVWKQEDYND